MSNLEIRKSVPGDKNSQGGKTWLVDAVRVASRHVNAENTNRLARYVVEKKYSTPNYYTTIMQIF